MEPATTSSRVISRRRVGAIRAALCLIGLIGGAGWSSASDDIETIDPIIVASKDQVDLSVTTKHRAEMDARRYPWSAIGRVNVAVSRRGHCTGALIGERLVLTAAHCLYFRANQSWVAPEFIHFLAGWQRDEFEAHSKAERYIVPPEFDGEKWAHPDNLPYDWALIVLSEPIGRKVGFLGWQELSQQQFTKINSLPRKFTIAGYPRDRAHTITIDSDCQVDGYFTNLNLLSHRCQIVNGDSGAPITVPRPGKLVVIGLNSAAGLQAGLETVNTAVPVRAFSKEALKLLGEIQPALDLEGRVRRYGNPPVEQK